MGIYDIWSFFLKPIEKTKPHNSLKTTQKNNNTVRTIILQEWRKNGERIEKDKVSYLGSLFFLIYLFISDNGSMSELINNIIIHII